MKMNVTIRKILVTMLLVTFAFVSIFCLGPFFGSEDNYDRCVNSLDGNVDSVMKLTAASTVASAVISAMPGDTATPIADKLADFSEYFLFILCVLYAEKYLLTVIGTATFYVLIPAACAGLALSQFVWPNFLRRSGIKLIAFAMVIVMTIPTSVMISDRIHETYRENIDNTLAAAEQFSEEAAEYSEAEDQSFIQSIVVTVTDTSKELLDKASHVLNDFIEAIAVMIVTSCVIPLFVLIFFIWVIRLFTGVSMQIPVVYRRGRKLHTKKI